MHGKAVPTFINVGAPKCGTTTLSKIADAAGALPFARKKEVDAFGASKAAATDKVDEADRVAFSAHSAFTCQPDNPTLYDMTPNYMSIPGMPRRVSEIYAGDAHGLCITAIIREPMAQMQSHMFYGPMNRDMTPARANNWARSEYDTLREHNMSTYDAMIANYESVPSQMARFALFGYQMKQWLTYFNPDRMILMPMMWAMENQVEAAELINAQCPHLRLNASGVADMDNTQKHSLNSATENKQPQSGLVFDMDVIRDYRQIYDEDLRALSQVLSDHTHKLSGVAIGGLRPKLHHGPAEIMAHVKRHWGAKDY
jgi:hypothetical protein